MYVYFPTDIHVQSYAFFIISLLLTNQYRHPFTINNLCLYFHFRYQELHGKDCCEYIRCLTFTVPWSGMTLSARPTEYNPTPNGWRSLIRRKMTASCRFSPFLAAFWYWIFTWACLTVTTFLFLLFINLENLTLQQKISDFSVIYRLYFCASSTTFTIHYFGIIIRLTHQLKHYLMAAK